MMARMKICRETRDVGIGSMEFVGVVDWSFGLKLEPAVGH
jgi:hypothetical protein